MANGPIHRFSIGSSKVAGDPKMVEAALGWEGRIVAGSNGKDALSVLPLPPSTPQIYVSKIAVDGWALSGGKSKIFLLTSHWLICLPPP